MDWKTCNYTETINKITDKNSLAFEFFAFFSRFEYALKKCGFVKTDRRWIEPDWDKYAERKEVEDAFANNQGECVRKAVALLSTKPPKKQIYINNKLDWEDASTGQSGTRHIFILVRRVRNNLFHGGKYPLPNGVGTDTSRNEDLLNASIIVLTHCLEYCDDVRNAFTEL